MTRAGCYGLLRGTALLLLVMWHRSARAQQSDLNQPYFSNGAAVTSVPAAGQPGWEFFANGAQATSVPAAGQPGWEFFANGAQATSVPAAGQPGWAFFANGAQATSVPTGQQPGAAYFSNGAQVLSVPVITPLFFGGPQPMSLVAPPQANGSVEAAATTTAPIEAQRPIDGKANTSALNPPSPQTGATQPPPSAPPSTPANAAPYPSPYTPEAAPAPPAAAPEAAAATPPTPAPGAAVTTTNAAPETASEGTQPTPDEPTTLDQPTSAHRLVRFLELSAFAYTSIVAAVVCCLAVGLWGFVWLVRSNRRHT